MRNNSQIRYLLTIELYILGVVKLYNTEEVKNLVFVIFFGSSCKLGNRQVQGPPVKITHRQYSFQNYGWVFLTG